MKRRERECTYLYDRDGEEIVLVPLANNPKPAKILRRDFEAILAAGFTHLWTLNSSGNGYSYVRCADNRRKGNLASVARLITKAGRNRIVHYRDENRLNLRRDNLILSSGNAKGITRKQGGL